MASFTTIESWLIFQNPDPGLPSSTRTGPGRCTCHIDPQVMTPNPPLSSTRNIWPPMASITVVAITIVAQVYYMLSTIKRSIIIINHKNAIAAIIWLVALNRLMMANTIMILYHWPQELPQLTIIGFHHILFDPTRWVLVTAWGR